MNLATFEPDHSEDATIRQVQTALQTAGYYPGIVDGEFLGKSRAALQRFRDDHANLTTPTPATTVPGLSYLQALILDYLAQYVGLIELVSNATWGDPHDPARAAVAEKLRKGLLALGCEPGWAYCVTGARLVRQEAYVDAGRAAGFAAQDKHMSVSVMGSYNALNEAGLTRRKPQVGAILFLQHIKTARRPASGTPSQSRRCSMITWFAPASTRARSLATWNTSAKAMASSPARCTRLISTRHAAAC